MGKGRKSHAGRVLVRELLADGLSERQIVAALWHLVGLSICRRTVGRIRDGVVRVSDSLLAPGERRLAEPATCGRGHKIDVVPCRHCRVLNREADQAAARRMALEQRLPPATNNEKRCAGDGSSGC